MIANNNEDIPPKEDCVASIKKSQSNLAINQPIDNPATKSTTSTETNTNSQGMFRTQFQQKTRILRDAWNHHQDQLKVTKDNWQLFTVICLTIFGIACNVAAISSNRWTCDTQLNFGLWDTCYQPITDGPIWEMGTNNNTYGKNDTVDSRPLEPIKCAKQGVRWVEIELAQQSRIDQVYAAQALLILGCILYIFSLFTICIGYKFFKTNRLSSLRNSLVISVLAQLVAFFLMLIGFYLFILTEQFSISVSLLFIYFGLAMLASNTINFITVEYREHTNRPCAAACE